MKKRERIGGNEGDRKGEGGGKDGSREEGIRREGPVISVKPMARKVASPPVREYITSRQRRRGLAKLLVPTEMLPINTGVTMNEQRAWVSGPP